MGIGLKSSLIRVRGFRRWLVGYLLRLFTLPRVRQEIARLAGLCMNEAGRFRTGIRGEAAQTAVVFGTLAKYMRREKITRQEKRHFKRQMINIFKSTGVVVPVMLIPLPFIGTLMLIILDHLLRSMNISILPSAFYPGDKKELLTRESVEEDLDRTIRGY